MATEADPPTFHPFPRLPAELRVHIWALAIPRNFLDATLVYPIAIHEDSVRQIGYRVIPARKSPALFVVNREARSKIARVDGGQWYPVDLSNHSGDAGGPRVYVNFKKEAGYVIYHNAWQVHKVGLRVWDDCRIGTMLLSAGRIYHYIVRWDWTRDCAV